MKMRDSEPKRIPSPSRNRNKPSSIGFLTYAYKPLVISLGGGLKGTGVPLARKNAMTGQALMSQPSTKSKIDSPRLHQEESKWGNESRSSTQREAKTKRTVNPKKNNAPNGVARILSLLFPVATR